MQDNYVILGIFNFGKRKYEVLNNNGEIKYFEKINDQYVMPIINFNLYENSGKSLTQVNQHYFMSELVKKIQESFKRKIFVTDEECSSFLDDFISKVCSDLEFKKLLKGSYMKDINEDNFELNKKRIDKYLNSYKFDTFIDYNNVSIFNGSISKLDNSDVDNESVELNKKTEVNNEVSEINDSEINNVETSKQEETEVIENNIIDYDIDIIDIQDDIDNNSQNSSLSNDSSKISESVELNNNININDFDLNDVDVESHVFDNEVSDDINLDENVYNDVDNKVNEKNNNLNDKNIVFGDENSDKFLNESSLNKNDDIMFGVSEDITFGENFSYLNEVKNRIQNNKSQVGLSSNISRNKVQEEKVENKIDNKKLDSSKEVSSKKSSKGKLFGRFFMF